METFHSSLRDIYSQELQKKLHKIGGSHSTNGVGLGNGRIRKIYD